MFDVKMAQAALEALEPNNGSPVARGLKMGAERLGECATLIHNAGALYVRIEEVVHVVGAALQIPNEHVTAVVTQAKLRAGDPPPDPGLVDSGQVDG